MDETQLPRGLSRETRIRRDALGRWWNGDDRIDHPNVARSFDAWIERAPDGRLCLRNDVNWAYAEIEGPPYAVRALRWRGDVAELVLSGDRVETLDPRSLRVDAEGSLYCDVLGGTLAARFDNAAAVALAERMDDDGALRVAGDRVLPPVVDDPLVTAWHRAASAVEPAP